MIHFSRQLQAALAWAPVYLIAAALCSCVHKQDTRGTAKALFQYDAGSHTRWSSQENLNGKVGAGGQANYGAKGAPYDSILPGATKTLLDIQGQGMITRIWITVNDRSPQMLRSLRLDMYWDNASKPAVSVPFGDFFGIGLGRTAVFANAVFANPEGRSFNCYIPMPFRTGARITVTNESTHKLNNIFFDVDFQLTDAWNDDNLYFHAYWSRDTATTLARDFELLPAVQGKGRFLGVNVGVNANPRYGTSWWGEGEVKMFLDSDGDLPTLNGTGTEDYIGTAWGQGQYYTDYVGCPIADEKKSQWTFYRFHIPDPVYFATACRVTLQQIGGHFKKDVAAYQRAGAPLIPVTIDSKKFTWLYKKDSVVWLDDASLPDGWTNFYRSDDVSATAYFYIGTPESNLPALQPLAIRTYNLKGELPPAQ